MKITYRPMHVGLLICNSPTGRLSISEIFFNAFVLLSAFIHVLTVPKTWFLLEQLN